MYKLMLPIRPMVLPLVLFFALVAGLLPAVVAADPHHPGYVDFERLSGFSAAEATVDVRLDGWLLGLARQAALESGDREAQILQGLDSIRVRIFESDGRHEELRDSADRLIGQLRRDGWEDFTTVRSPDGYVFVMVTGDQDRIDGLTVVALGDDQEAVFVNVAGSIRAKDIASLISDGAILHGDLDFDF